MSAFGSLWQRLHGGLDSHSFVRLAQTCALSSAGDALVAVALAGSVFFSQDPDSARTSVALSLLLTMAPFALVAPFLGPWVDRARGGRRLVLVSSGALRSLLCLMMASVLEQVWLYPVAFMILVCSKTHAVAKSASVPEIIGSPDALVRANSILQIFAVLSGFVAAGVGFAIAQIAGDEWILRVAAVLLAAEAAVALGVGATRGPMDQDGKTRPVGDLADTGIFPAAAAMAAMRLSVGFLTFLIAFDFRRTDAATLWFGAAITASLVGASLGNVVAPQMRGRIREEWMLVGCGLTICAGAVGVTQVSGRLSGVVLAFVVGLAAGAAKLAFDSLVQRDAPSAVHGRSFARFEALFQLVWVVGALLPVIIVISAPVGYTLLAVLCGSMALWYGTTHLRRRPHARNL